MPEYGRFETALQGMGSAVVLQGFCHGTVPLSNSATILAVTDV